MIRLITVCVFLFSFSCNSVINKNSKILNQDTVGFITLAQDYYGGRSIPEFLVIKEEKALYEVYNLINNGRTPKLETPKINFEKKIVIVLFLGEKSSGGYSIAVKEIMSFSDKIIVTYKIDSPEKGEMVTTVMTQPYCIIKISKTLKEVFFKEAI